MSISSINTHTALVGNRTATMVDQAAQTRFEKFPATAANTDDLSEGKSAIADVADAVKLLNNFVETQSQGIQFSLDDGSGKIVVKIVDVETNAVLRQIPSAEALSIARSLDKLQGLLIREKA